MHIFIKNALNAGAMWIKFWSDLKSKHLPPFFLQLPNTDIKELCKLAIKSWLKTHLKWTKRISFIKNALNTLASAMWIKFWSDFKSKHLPPFFLQLPKTDIKELCKLAIKSWLKTHAKWTKSVFLSHLCYLRSFK